MRFDITENLPYSFKMHSSMCLELKSLVNRIMRIFPDIEDARPGCSSGIQTLCLLYKALENAKRLLQYCSESSKLYMAVTGEAILLRACKAKKSLEQSLTDIRSMVPTVLAMKIAQLIQDLRSTMLSLDSYEEQAGKAFRDLMRRSTSSSVSSDEIRDFHLAAMKLHLTTPESIVTEQTSLKSLLSKLNEREVNKRQILKYLLCLLKKHERIISREHKDNSFRHQQSLTVEYKQTVTLPEQFKCPLSLTVMYDPVIISSGHTYERVWIQKWFDEGNDSCPESKMKLDSFTLTPNLAVRDQIANWCGKNGLSVQDPSRNIDFSISSIASFGSSLHNIPDLSGFSSCSFDSPSYSKMSKGGYFTPMKTIDSDVTDSSQSEVEEIEPLSGLNDLPFDEQRKLVEEVRSRFKGNAYRSMSVSNFLDPLIVYLKNADGEVKAGLDLLLAFLMGNIKAVESLEEDVFKMLSVFLEKEEVVEEALNILEVISNYPQVASSICLSALLKIAETTRTEQAMIILKNLSSSNEICVEMVSLFFIQKLTCFLQGNVFCKHCIVILKNLCNSERGRVCVTETPGCLASIADLLESDETKEVENAISILLQLCVEKIEYCYLIVREAVDIYSSLLLISNNGSEEAKVGAAELLRALEEVDLNGEDQEQEQEAIVPAAPSLVVVAQVVHQETMTRTQSPKKSGLFGFSLLSLKKKKR